MINKYCTSFLSRVQQDSPQSIVQYAQSHHPNLPIDIDNFGFEHDRGY